MSNYPTVRHLRAFEAVARLKSFGQAANELCISASALSQNISQMEEILAVRLIDRTTRHMQLTPIGEQLQPQVLRWLREMEETFTEVSNEGQLSSGHVRVATLTSLAIDLLPRAISELQKSNPGIRISILDDTGTTVERRVAEREADFGLAGGPIRNPVVEFIPLFEEPYHILCAADHPLTHKDGPVTWRDLSCHPFIGLSEDTNIGKQLRFAPQLEGLLPRASLEVSQLGTLWGLIRKGLGISAVPASACLRVQEMRALPLVSPIITRQLGLVTNRNRSQAPAARLFQKTITRIAQGDLSPTEDS